MLVELVQLVFKNLGSVDDTSFSLVYYHYASSFAFRGSHITVLNTIPMKALLQHHLLIGYNLGGSIEVRVNNQVQHKSGDPG